MTTKRSGSYEYNAICDVCGFKFKASQLQLRWDGYLVCKEDWEPRNILDFFKPRDDNHKLPWTRPDDTGPITWIPTWANVTYDPEVVISAWYVRTTSFTTPETYYNNFTVQITIPVGKVFSWAATGEITNMPGDNPDGGDFLAHTTTGNFTKRGLVVTGTTILVIPLNNQTINGPNTFIFSGKYRTT